MNLINQEFYLDVFGFDEFKGNTNRKKYLCQITDLDTSRVIDVLKSKDTRYLEQYFHSIKNRLDIELVSIDMCLSFKRIIKQEFPKAVIIVDRFHYTRMAIKALDEIRIGLENECTSDEKKLLKHSSRLLIAHYNNLSFAQSTRLHKVLKIDKKLEIAHNFKENFLSINEKKDFDIKKQLFDSWLLDVSNCGIKEFESHVKSLKDWYKYIVNSFRYDYSSAKVEGKNNKIKVIKRMAFGFRNFDNFRSKILSVCGNIS